LTRFVGITRFGARFAINSYRPITLSRRVESRSGLERRRFEVDRDQAERQKAMKVQEFLLSRCVEFDVIGHPDTYNAQHLAETLHVSGLGVAKTVLLKADRGYAYIVAVLPASSRIDLAKISEALGGSQIELATEDDVEMHCPDCECGALTPFGTHYGMRTLVDESFVGSGKIIFEGNTHREAIRMRYEDFQRLESPLVADFAIEAKEIA
jgi:Ala-tRNA(Pro) deacylase